MGFMVCVEQLHLQEKSMVVAELHRTDFLQTKGHNLVNNMATGSPKPHGN